MSSYSPKGPSHPNHPQKSSRGIPIWGWLLICLFGLVTLVCGGGLVGLVIVGVNSPETQIYLGHEVPKSYLDVAKEIGGLENGEKVKFFYSDGIMGIEEGFYYVSDRKVVTYNDDGRVTPLIEMPFGDITDIYLERDESFLIDSEITIELKDGTWVSFPVSSEHDRDEKFADEIRKRIGGN